MRAGESLLSPDGYWRWDGTAWRPAPVAPSLLGPTFPAAIVACIVGTAIWMPTMALQLSMGGSPSRASWAWYAGLMLVASIGLAALNPGQWRTVGAGLVVPQVVLAIFSSPHENGVPWWPIFLILVVVALAATGVAAATAGARHGLFPGRVTVPAPRPVLWVTLGIGLGAGALALFMLLLWLLFFLPFRDAGEDLRAEASILEIDGGRIVAIDYRPGVCFDNCPVLQATYRYDEPVTCGRVIDALEAAGYRDQNSSSRVERGRGRYSVTILEPAGGCASLATPVDTVRVFWESSYP